MHPSLFTPEAYSLLMQLIPNYWIEEESIERGILRSNIDVDVTMSDVNTISLLIKPIEDKSHE